MPYVNKGLSTKICALTKKVSGSTITINNQFGDRLLDLKALVTATQSGSGDPAPDNVRLISGWNNVALAVSGDTVSINLGDTYYGGVLDVTSGVLHVTHRMRDLGDISLTYTASDPTHPYGFFRFLPSDKKNGVINIISEIYKTNPSGSFNNDYTIMGTSTYYTSYIVDSRYDDSDLVDGKLPALSGYKLIYELKDTSQFDIQLTPTQIDLIAGSNTIFADSGNVEAIYKTFTP